MQFIGMLAVSVFWFFIGWIMRGMQETQPPDSGEPITLGVKLDPPQENPNQ